MHIKEAIMLEFHPITLEDKERVNALICASGCHGADYSFANLYIWRDTWHPEICEVGGRIIVSTAGTNVYSYPKGGGDQKASVEALISHARERGQKIIIRGLTDRTLPEFLADYDGLFAIEEDRDNADYIYSTEKLRYLAGRKLSSKRNHIKHFERNGDWCLKRLGCGCDCSEAEYFDSNGRNIEICSMDDARAFVQEFYKEKDDPELASESIAIDCMFDNFCELGFTGALLYQNGEPVAFTAATRLGETVMDVHFEKALPGIDGAYTMINREFVNLIAQIYPDIEFFNREEDMGIEGLRRAKSSYQPDILLMKYIAVEKTDD